MVGILIINSTIKKKKIEKKYKTLMLIASMGDGTQK